MSLVGGHSGLIRQKCNEKLALYEPITFNIQEVISTAVYELSATSRLYCVRKE